MMAVLMLAFHRDPKLRTLAPLIKRALADFETALEATFSGYVAVALDAMRDVMEIENLLLDFSREAGQAERWLAADDRLLRREFSPVNVRQRLKAAGLGHFDENAGSLDYKGHSMSLHVSPQQSLMPEKGFLSDDPVQSDMGFWEMFQHARNLWSAIVKLTSTLAPGSAAAELAKKEPTKLAQAWRATQGAQGLFTAYFEGRVKRLEGDIEGAVEVLTRALLRTGSLQGTSSAGTGEVVDQLRRLAEAKEDPSHQVAGELLSILEDSDTAGEPLTVESPRGQSSADASDDQA
ncbi:hypothetical protein AB0N07_13545 [Streptomyces sp. NPDC051172]|uniref:hypothetical protein n=1 Tax=Streptomyces sp. NPDC051172 TaxID=3155796 RepID=UPI0034318FCC